MEGGKPLLESGKLGRVNTGPRGEGDLPSNPVFLAIASGQEAGATEYSKGPVVLGFLSTGKGNGSPHPAVSARVGGSGREGIHLRVGNGLSLGEP